MNQLSLYSRHPYTAGMISVLWIGTAGMFATDQTMPIIPMICADVVISLLFAALGFRAAR